MVDHPGPPAIDRRSCYYRRILATVRSYRMLLPGDRVLATVSGGGDSVYLLMALRALSCKLNLEIEVAHLDHGVRGAEGAEDARFVDRLCRDWGHRLHQERLVASVAGRRESPEEALRRERYRFFHRVARQRSLRRIATGHSADDQAETVLLRLLTGAGLRGMGGIQPVRADGVIRPLLELRRLEIREQLQRLGVPYREDSSNQKLGPLRNRLRHRLLPDLEELGIGAIPALGRSAELAREDERLLQRLATERSEELLRDGGLDLTGLGDLPEALCRRILHRFLEEALGRPPAWRLVRSILELRRTGRTGVDLGGSLRGIMDQGVLRVSRIPSRGRSAVDPDDTEC